MSDHLVCGRLKSRYKNKLVVTVIFSRDDTDETKNVSELYANSKQTDSDYYYYHYFRYTCNVARHISHFILKGKGIFNFEIGLRNR